MYLCRILLSMEKIVLGEADFVVRADSAAVMVRPTRTPTLTHVGKRLRALRSKEPMTSGWSLSVMPIPPTFAAVRTVASVWATEAPSSGGRSALIS
jgi:hypothetical protein